MKRIKEPMACHFVSFYYYYHKLVDFVLSIGRQRVGSKLVVTGTGGGPFQADSN